MTFTFDSGTVDEIQFLIPQEKLLAGTTGGGIYAVYGSEQDLTITPTNFTIRREGTQPAEKTVNAVAVDENVIYVEGSGVKVRLVNFGNVSSAAKSFDVTIRSNDILDDDRENRLSLLLYQTMPIGFEMDQEQLAVLHTFLRTPLLHGIGTKLVDLTNIPREEVILQDI